MRLSILIFTLITTGLVGSAWSQDLDAAFGDASTDTRWIPPPPVDAADRWVAYDLQALYQNDVDQPNSESSLLDISLKRPLDENAVWAEASLRVEKGLSTNDRSDDVQLRLARLTYSPSWVQITLGRFDLFQTLSPGLFFGGYPLMGIHRVDGVLVTVPFSFFFRFGPAQAGQTDASSPLALSFFYAPSLFSAQEVQLDGSQDFFLGQLRLRLDGDRFQTTFRANLGESPNDFFTYSSFNGGLTGSFAADLRFDRNYALTGEYGIQNLQHLDSTSVLTLGFQADRLGTWGDLSLDQIALEGQFPLGASLQNPFTGGNGFTPSLASLPRDSFYLKVRARLKVLFLEFHLTNNLDDYTFDRLSPASVSIPFEGGFGPGRESAGPGTVFRGFSYQDPGFLLRTGIEF